MKIIDIADFDAIIRNKQSSFEVDINLYKNRDELAASVAGYAIELLEQLKTEVHGKAFDGVIDRYKSGREDG